MTRAFNIEGLVRLQNYMGGKTLSDAQFFAVLNADVVEMIDGEDSTTKRRYFRIAENDESITFSCILGSSQQQMVVTKATKQLDVTTTEIGGTIAPGSITSEMLADKAVTRKKLANAAVGSEALGDASVTSVKILDGAVTSKKLAPGLDVSGLFFILPKGTNFPYTLTKEDKAKLANARFLTCVGSDGVISVALHPVEKSYVGSWFGIYSTSRFTYISVTESVINAPSSIFLYDLNAVRFSSSQTLTVEQKTQARANIESADAGLFFTLPEGTQFPYTLTEADKAKLSAATVLILPTTRGLTPFQRSSSKGVWCSLRYTNTLWVSVVSESSISTPVANKIIDDTAVKVTAQTFTAAQKLQARTNIGAAEDPNTSGDSSATLEEPPVADEETIL